MVEVPIKLKNNKDFYMLQQTGLFVKLSAVFLAIQTVLTSKNGM